MSSRPTSVVMGWPPGGRDTTCLHLLRCLPHQSAHGSSPRMTTQGEPVPAEPDKGLYLAGSTCPLLMLGQRGRGQQYFLEASLASSSPKAACLQSHGGQLAQETLSSGCSDVRKHPPHNGLTLQAQPTLPLLKLWGQACCLNQLMQQQQP